MLHSQYPDAHISLLCKPFAISLTHGNPHIHFVTSNWKDLSGSYDLIVDMRGSWRSIFYAATHPPKIRLDRGTVRFRNRRRGGHPHEVYTNLELVEPVVEEKNRSTEPRIYSTKEEHAKVDDFLNANHIGRYALIHPGARKELRRWDKYPALARWLKQKRGLDVVIVGDRSEQADIAMLQDAAGVPTHSTAGVFSLSELAALASRAEIFIGNESGPLHIASVTGTRALGLYGPGEPHVFYPWGKRTAYLHVVLECNPCDQVHCVHPEFPCILRIGVDEVTEKVENLLKQSP
jgi:heptosyltransferase-3